MNEREKAHRELTHALRALHEQTGKASQGPSAIARRVIRRDPQAGLALCEAAITLERMGVIDKVVGLPALEKLAPVLLDIGLDRAEGATPGTEALSRLGAIGRLMQENRL